MLPNEQPQPGPDVLRPDIINPLMDPDVQKDLSWILENPSFQTQADKRLATLASKLWRHIQRLDGAWRIQQDRLIQLEEDQEFAQRLEQLEERLEQLGGNDR